MIFISYGKVRSPVYQEIFRPVCLTIAEMARKDGDFEFIEREKKMSKFKMAASTSCRNDTHEFDNF